MKQHTTLVNANAKSWAPWRTALLLAGTLALGTTTKAQEVFNETFTGGASTAGFTITQSLGTCGWVYNNPHPRSITGANFDTDFAIFDSDNCGNGPGEATGELLSPVFDASASNNFILTFDQSYQFCCSSVATVAVWDGTTWNTVYTLPSSSVGYPNPAVSESFSITAAANGYTAAQIRFQYDGDWAYWWALDNIVLTGVDCLAPSDLAVTGITPIGGTISWTDNGSAGYSWAVTTGDVPDGTNEVAEGDGSITTITGLNSNTSYTAWVRADCGDGSFSDWSAGVAFTTPPTCVQPTNPVISNLTISSADLAWTASVSTPANGYQWEVRTANGPGTGSNGLTTSGTTAAGITSDVASTLSANTHYSLYVRADCGSGDFSVWTSGTAFNTLCTASDIPYYEDLSSVTVPAIPNCMSIQTISGNPWTSSTSTLPGMTSPTARVSYTNSGAPPMDSWLYTAGLNLNAGVSYQLIYKYGNNSTSYTESMSVSYGTSASEAGMVDLLQDHPTINDNTLHIDTVNFTPSSSGVFYIGFKCYSVNNQYYLLLDDISLTLTPACYSPVASYYVAPDCANSQYFVHVNLTSLGDATSVDIMSDYTGNPGGQTGITATGDYTVGPFPNLSTVNISVVHTTDDSCTIALDPITYDCSDFGKNALSFDGVDDRVNCGNNPSVAITGNSVTMEAWIYPTAWKANTYQANIINSEGGNTGYMLRCGAGGELDFNLGDGAGFHQLISPANTLTLNTWQYVAGTYDGDSMRMYVNGVQIMALYGVFNIGATGTGLAVGDWSNGTGRNFPGKIDEVRVWSTAVSGANIMSHMNTAYCGNETGLVAYYQFDQGIANGANPAETTLNDGTAYANNGTLTGFALDGASSNWVVGVTDIGDCVALACVAPISVTITNPTDNGFDISWTDVGAASYEYEVRSSGAAGSGLTGLEASGSPVSGSPAITISGLAANADYSVYVRSACDGGLFSDWTPAVTFHLGYCIPAGTSTIWYINDFVTTGGSTNIDNSGSGLSTGGYGDFSAQTVSNYAGESFNFTADYVGNTFHTRIWVDWNNDFDFDDAGELVFDGTVYVSTATGTITIPAGTPEGSYRMRIRQGEIGTPTSCGSSIYGEAEDYTITVTSPPSCVHPTDIVTTSVTSASVNFSWTAPVPAPANGYQWEVRSNGNAGSGSVGLQSTGTTAAGVTNDGATGLTTDTDYFIYVRSICGDGDTSSWEGPTDIHTGYCAISFSSTSSTYFTNFVTTGGISNISNATGFDANGYGNYTSMVVSQTAGLSVDFATTMFGGDAGTAIWVDWNNDLDFNDPGEQVFVTTLYGYDQTGTITVPAGTPDGNYRMRILCNYLNSAPTSACGAIANSGEAEDYTFQVVSSTVDCEGVFNGPALPGTACVGTDGLAGVWSDACVCVENAIVDCEGVAGGPALPGTACTGANGFGGIWSQSCDCVENVGVDEIAGTAGFAIYPNPASTTLYISTTNKTPVHIKVYDMMGTLVMEKDMAEQLDITKLATGSYTLVATDAKGENERHARFMKQ